MEEDLYSDSNVVRETGGKQAADKEELFSADDLEILKETRRLRSSIIHKLMKGGTEIPDDKSDKVLLATMLADRENEIFKRVKIKQAAKAEEQATDLNETLAQLLLQVRHPESKPFNPAMLVPPEHLAPPKLKPGQADVGMVSITMADIKDD